MPKTKEKFQVDDIVTPNIMIDPPEGFSIKAGQQFEVEACKNGSTKLVNIDEPVETETLMLFPPETEETLQFALAIIERDLISVPDAARLVGIVQVYMRNLIATAGNHELPNPIIIEIGGKQFVRRSFVENIKQQRDAKNNKLNSTFEKFAEQHKQKTGHNNAPSSKNEGLFDSGKYDQLEEMTLAELKDYARACGNIKLSQNKTNLISDIRLHAAERRGDV